MTPRPLNGLYARMTAPAVPAVPLVRRERRQAGDEFPVVPAGGMGLSPEEVAAALFEAGVDVEYLGSVPGTDALYEVLKKSADEQGPVGIVKLVSDFSALDSAEFWEVADCRRFAYRLALSFWYEGARSRPMTVGEAAVALYLSDAYRHHQVDALTIRRAPLLVSRAVRQGAATVPVETLVRLGAAMVREFTTPASVTPVTERDTQVSTGDTPRDTPGDTPGDTQAVTDPVSASQPGVTCVAPGRDWLYRQALPDWHRRRFCFDLMRADTRQPTPLIVRLDDEGGYVVGATPPAGPDGTWARSLRAGW
ncbi:hypothetical protein [Streptomyces acidiscabies]|uniref:hypothetical protein n=1 Tax=Streptomyces acidiscabies TaxID=42234 RepID=UPI000A4820B2|nr:hypothetical protein [Streptomyces acidiscabies]